MHKIDLKNKKVVVVGLARSGVASAILLKSAGAKVFVSDIKDDVDTRNNKEELEAQQIEVELGKHSPGLFCGADLVVVSPGVRFDALCLNWARAKNIPVIGEIELAASFCPAPIIAVTGTNGKSTTTALIGEILKLSGRKVHICGNIGKAFSQEAVKIAKDDIVSLEVSSFQLETIVDFKPKVSVILNFNRNHLDRHKDMDEYLMAKKRIFMNQDKDDFTVLNMDDAVLKNLACQTKAEVRFFESSLDIGGFKLNANQAAALRVGEIFKIEKKDALGVIRGFKGLPHRMEFVDTVSGIDFINDSKATTVDSCAWALKNIYKPVILIAGGRDKGADFRSIRDLVRRKVKTLIAIGEAGNKIKDAYKGVTPVIGLDNFKAAVYAAKDLGCEGDCILLSPMCASFDMFRDYEERGRVFKEIVRELKK
ncbi:MAG: UDP-N-acetylmuramoyl-L-alanine--D-glutamate ligase [Candidatus Omnitrophota bacterium]|nr:UDP-N-acetylmuramoyl-L-alanine--D-glutamate ligase [Candidatus Omnitrophota bacterium]